MDIKNAKILVTGSSGTIGNYLCEKLMDLGADVTGVDIKKNIWNYQIDERTIYLDLRDQNLLKKLPVKFDMVIHLAANARVFNLVKNPDLARDNFLMIYNVLEHIRKNDMNRIIFSSSREVYGNTDYIIHSEDEAYVRHCESSYTATKIAGEAMIHSYNQCYDMDFIITRFSNVYGKYDYSDRVIPLFILKAVSNEDITVFGRDKILDFTYIEDTVSGIINSIVYFESAKNEVYNIATQKGASIEKVAKNILELTNSGSKLYFGENRLGEVCKFVADINKAKALIDYNPEYSLFDGLKKTIEWYLPKLKEYKKSLISQGIVL